MTLHPTPVTSVPEETARIARAAVSKGNVYLQMRDVLGSIYTDEQFADLFAGRGRPVVPPWRLALVTVMQFAEGLSDRQAAEAVRVRIDWKYALGLELTDAGFDYSVLSEFRARLVAGSAEERLLEVLLAACTQHGLLKARGKQRTDSTHVLAVVRTLHRLERVAETVRATLNALARIAPDWLRTQMSPDWFDRYGRRIEEERLPKGQTARRAYTAQVGADGQRLLDAVDGAGAPEAIRHASEVATLRQVWEQQFRRAQDGGFELCPPKALPKASEIVESPYEREARYALKRGRHWVGYKVHLSETCDAETPHLITQVHTTLAPAHDVEQLLTIQQSLAERHLLPAQQLVDTGYTSVRNLARSQTRYQIELIGPVYLDRQWQGRVADGFTIERFQIDWDRRRVTCPQGRGSVGWSETTSAQGRSSVHVTFAPADCVPCPARARCTRAKTGGGARALTLKTRAEHDLLEAARVQQQTNDFAALYAQRAGIEGALSQGVRAFGLRQARYRGLRKTHLQDVATAAAMDLSRLHHWFKGDLPTTTRRPRFARLAAA
ncbi:MAG TPA: IS1182 family transposase [Ktedonobacterales bacterium]|jgi:transposase|nr:IS1182 family transposase [Ktedonobacterales bacterium]